MDFLCFVAALLVTGISFIGKIITGVIVFIGVLLSDDN